MTVGEEQVERVATGNKFLGHCRGRCGPVDAADAGEEVATDVEEGVVVCYYTEGNVIRSAEVEARRKMHRLKAGGVACPTSVGREKAALL